MAETKKPSKKFDNKKISGVIDNAFSFYYEDMLADMVDEGVITQRKADSYDNVRQKIVQKLKSKPPYKFTSNEQDTLDEVLQHALDMWIETDKSVAKEVENTFQALSELSNFSRRHG